MTSEEYKQTEKGKKTIERNNKIFEEYKNGELQVTLSKKYNLSCTRIQQIIARLQRHLDYKEKQEEPVYPKGVIMDLILEILHLSMKCESIGFHCFCDYSGHVNTLDFTLHDGEWKVCNEEKVSIYGIDVEDSPISIRICDTIIKNLEYILENKKINYELLIKYKPWGKPIKYIFDESQKN